MLGVVCRHVLTLSHIVMWTVRISMNVIHRMMTQVIHGVNGGHESGGVSSPAFFCACGGVKMFHYRRCPKFPCRRPAGSTAASLPRSLAPHRAGWLPRGIRPCGSAPCSGGYGRAAAGAAPVGGRCPPPAASPCPPAPTAFGSVAPLPPLAPLRANPSGALRPRRLLSAYGRSLCSLACAPLSPPAAPSGERGLPPVGLPPSRAGAPRARFRPSRPPWVPLSSRFRPPRFRRGWALTSAALSFRPGRAAVVSSCSPWVVGSRLSVRGSCGLVGGLLAAYAAARGR